MAYTNLDPLALSLQFGALDGELGGELGALLVALNGGGLGHEWEMSDL